MIYPVLNSALLEKKRGYKMSKFKIAILCSVSVIFVFILYIFCSLLYSITPTKGNKISNYTHPGKALLVIDVQEDYTGETAKPPFPYKESETAIASINRIALNAAQKKYDVIYIRQEFCNISGKIISMIFANGTAIKGKPGTRIDKRVNIISSNIFSKPIGDAFSNKEFEKYLIDHSVNELYLVGLDAEACVHATAKGALNRGYTVKIVTDAILLKVMKKWNDLLKKYSEEGIFLIQSSDI
jgi:nicotinamidase/pyrazinamidase